MPPGKPPASCITTRQFCCHQRIPPLELLDELDETLPGRLDYSLSLKILVLKMPSYPHEEAAGQFEAMVTTLALQMKVRRRLSYPGSVRVKGKHRAKQADQSWMPVRSQGQFPTVALEVDYTETAACAKLERDIAWWIGESGGQMRMGITIDIKRGSNTGFR